MKVNFIGFFFQILIVSTIFQFSCNNVKNTNNLDQLEKFKNKYARLFKIEKSESIKKLSVFDPNGNTAEQYYLLNNNTKIPDSLKGKSIIKTPVKNIVCLSTTHIAFIDALEETDKIKALSGSQYIYNPKLRKRIDAKDLKDVGYENSLDFELILSLKPDMVTVYDINGSISPTINKLKQYGIPVVQINEYLESSVLGQAEWLKFFAAFFEKDTEAEKKFDAINKRYLQLKKICDIVKNRPTVLLNMPWKGTWYVPGGKSNMAQLIQDAGGNYIWSNTNEQHNYALNIEEIYDKARNADFWLNPGQANSLKNIISDDIRLEKFKPFKTGQVYNRNKRLNSYGGNDYMESGTVNPDLILKDLIRILHPELLPEDTLYYYRKLY